MNEVIQKTIQKTIQIEENKEYVFRNQVDFCIGTGRMGLALTKEYQEQLSLYDFRTFISSRLQYPASPAV